MGETEADRADVTTDELRRRIILCVVETGERSPLTPYYETP